MIICIDFDGVVADTCSAKRRWLRQNWAGGGFEGRVSKTALEQKVGALIYARMQASIGFEDTLLAAPKAGCLGAVQRLKAFAELHIVSARNADKLFWVEQWLVLNGFSRLFDGIHSSFGGAKADTLSQLDADCLIDDDCRHFVGIGRARAILFGTDEVGHGANFQRARNWDDVEILLN